MQLRGVAVESPAVDDVVAECHHAGPIEPEHIGIGELLPDLTVHALEVGLHRARAVEVDRDLLGPDGRAQNGLTDEASGEPLAEPEALATPTAEAAPATQASGPLTSGRSRQAAEPAPPAGRVD